MISAKLTAPEGVTAKLNAAPGITAALAAPTGITTKLVVVDPFVVVNYIVDADGNRFATASGDIIILEEV